jgi:hypothetical protein
MYLETKHAKEIVNLLEDAQDVGLQYVVFEQRPTERYLHPGDLELYDTLGDALERWEHLADQRYLPGDGDYPVYYVSVEQLLDELKKQNQLTINEKSMNLNNLENLKDEMKALGFKQKLINEMEVNMRNNVPAFNLYDQSPGSKGIVDTTLYFKQSGQSEHYYFNKFEVALDKGGKALEPEQRYVVISPGEKPGKNLTRPFENPHKAIEYFKAQQGNSELALVKGQDFEHKIKLATMENGKVNYVTKEFQRTYNNPAVTQTFYIENGHGFTAQQGANLIQDRAVYRDDLTNAAGMTYKAWVKLELGQAKDRHGNFLFKHYHDPSYGFNLEKVLDKYQIKELENPQQREKLEQSLRQGDRPLVTVAKEGQEMKLFLEAVPRYSQINLYQENGKPEKREQFLKPELSQNLQIGKGKEQAKEQEQGMAV